MFQEKANLNQLLKLVLLMYQLIFDTGNIFFQFLDIHIEHYQDHILQHMFKKISGPFLVKTFWYKDRSAFAINKKQL